MMRKGFIAIFLGTAVFMTACGGNGASVETGQEASSAGETESVYENDTVYEDDTEFEDDTELEDDSAFPEDFADMIDESYEEDVFEMPETDIELEDGILTIRLSGGSIKEGYYWSYYTGDKGDATLVELLTDSDQDGYTYAGSFRAVPECGDGQDYVRVAFSNGDVIYAYIDLNVEIKDSQITDYSSLSYCPSDLSDQLVGTWVSQSDETVFLSISSLGSGDYDMVISDGSGTDGITKYTEMTACYDAVKEALVYTDGTVYTGEISDVVSDEEVTEAEEEAHGTGVFVLKPDESLEKINEIEWNDMTFGNDPATFVKQ